MWGSRVPTGGGGFSKKCFFVNKSFWTADSNFLALFLRGLDFCGFWAGKRPHSSGLLKVSAQLYHLCPPLHICWGEVRWFLSNKACKCLMEANFEWSSSRLRIFTKTWFNATPELLEKYTLFEARASVRRCAPAELRIAVLLHFVRLNHFKKHCDWEMNSYSKLLSETEKARIKLYYYAVRKVS